MQIRRRIYFLLITLLTITHSLPNTITWYQSTVHNSYPDGLSFCIVDLKFDGQKIKICEFGQGFDSGFKGYDALYGKGQLWAKFWAALASLKKPLWLLGSQLKRDLAPDSYKKAGGYVAHAINEIKSFSSPFILMVCGTHKKNFSAFEFKKNHPECIILDEVTKKFVSNKYETCLLFDDHELATYRPRFMLIPKEYTPTLTYDIAQQLNSQYIVIKPINASLGRGIVAIEPPQLDCALLILCKKQNSSLAPHDEDSYAYWASDREKFFIAEEFVPSKTILVDSKPYDPTMRVAFVLFNNAGTPCVSFLDAYWKLPTKSLNEQGTFTELHKSHVVSKTKCSAPVDPSDFESVKAQLCLLLPQIYLKMLATYWDNKQEPTA